MTTLTIAMTTITANTTGTAMAIVVVRDEPKIMQIVNKVCQLTLIQVLLFCNQIIVTNK